MNETTIKMSDKNKIRIIFRGREMKDDFKISEYLQEPDSIVNVV